MKWHRDRESGMTHGYRRSAEVAACGKALRIEAEERRTAMRIARCRLCRRALRAEEEGGE